MNGDSPVGLSRIASVVLLGLGLAISAATPQDASRPPLSQTPKPVFRVNSNLVQVDVTVRNKKGNLVRDLRKEDFVVYEDGTAQEIVTFSFESISGPAPELPAKEETAPKLPTVNLSITPKSDVKTESFRDKRLIILFFDLSSLQTEELIRSVETARDYVEKKSTPSDLIAITTYSSTLQLAQDLTNDRAVLLAALKKLNPTEAGDAPQENLDESDASDDSYVPDDVQFNIFNTDRRLSALSMIAKGYRDFPERKSLILFSSGMSTTGVENQSQIRFTVDTANQSNMSIYTIDSRGLQALPPGGGASSGSPGGRALFTGSAMRSQSDNLSASQETLTTLAQDTGGTAFQDTNDLSPIFTKVVSDTQAYYVLGYYSSNGKEDGKFRKIRVEARRPDLKLQHRPGYFASKQFLKLTQTERDRQLEEALAVDKPFSDLPIILEANYFRKESGISLVPLSMQIAGDAVQFDEKKNQREAAFEFLAQVMDQKGRVAGIARDTVQVKLPPQTAEKIRAGQILYTTGFELKPGDYKLKFLVRDNRTGRIGSFEQALAVPQLDGKSLQTSSIVLGSRLVDSSSESQGVEHRGFRPPWQMQDQAHDPLTIGSKRIVPSIGNVFLGRQTVYVYFQAYGVAEDPKTRKPQVETSLMLLQGNVKVRESEPQRVEEWGPGGKGSALIAMAVPLRGLKRGNYTLQIHLSDEVSDTNLFKRVPIVIE
jgi:VWFA-related protein